MTSRMMPHIFQPAAIMFHWNLLHNPFVKDLRPRGFAYIFYVNLNNFKKNHNFMLHIVILFIKYSAAA